MSKEQRTRRFEGMQPFKGSPRGGSARLPGAQMLLKSRQDTSGPCRQKHRSQKTGALPPTGRVTSEKPQPFRASVSLSIKRYHQQPLCYPAGLQAAHSRSNQHHFLPFRTSCQAQGAPPYFGLKMAPPGLGSGYPAHTTQLPLSKCSGTGPASPALPGWPSQSQTPNCSGRRQIGPGRVGCWHRMVTISMCRLQTPWSRVWGAAWGHSGPTDVTAGPPAPQPQPSQGGARSPGGLCSPGVSGWGLCGPRGAGGAFHLRLSLIPLQLRLRLDSAGRWLL